jgi:hypothetical protein
MINNLSFFLLYSFGLLLANCQNHGKLDIVADLPSSLKETSGLVSYTNYSFWAIEDSGNSDRIYQLNFKGEILKDLKVKNGKNQDWEDLTKDKHGNIYIGDFGNNANTRKNLVIYKLPNPEIEPGDKIDAEKIEFSYPEQTEFPPKKDSLYFDAEAFFHWNNALYLITKNRSRPYNGMAYIYKIPDEPGAYKAELVTEWTICEDANSCSATSAAISEDEKTIAVLTYGKLLLFTDFNSDNFIEGKLKIIDLNYQSQLESVCFLNNSTLLLADEKVKTSGGNLYEFHLN